MSRLDTSSYYIVGKEIEVRYLPTEDMIADILTKHLHGLLFATLCAKLTGVFEKCPEHNTDHQPYSSTEQSTLARPVGQRFCGGHYLYWTYQATSDSGIYTSSHVNGWIVAIARPPEF